MTDYAEPLRVIWGRVRCPADTCGAFSWELDEYCKGHAALLEMVDEFHVSHGEGCRCDRQSTSWACKDKRRRLRAAVGVDDESKRA